MQGRPEVLEALNDVLTAELTAVNQYFVHAKMCANWGYRRLAHKKRDEAIEEMKHADTLIERILYLDGTPNMQRLGVVRVGEEVAEQHRLDLEMEKVAVERLNRAIALCREQADNGSRALLEHMLAAEEESVDWLEAQLHQIGEMGTERYLAEQMHD